ncbi:hypothetical protein JTB14_035816 [Gonioctena quinquepunctata]|nr:hypothetical protein JTB14_035816 [Gonioctena quinquepunctata]
MFIHYPIQLSICNIYLPDGNWTIEDLKNIADQLPALFLIVEDFNSHNPLWGSNRLDNRRRTIENFIDEINLTLLNDGDGTRWISRNASWDLHRQELGHLQLPDTDVNEATELISRELLAAAEILVPSGQKNYASTTLKRSPTLENTIAFKRGRARARRAISESKRATWEAYVFTITYGTPASEIWTKIRAIIGKRFTDTPQVLEIDGQLIISGGEIAEHLAQQFEYISSSEHYDPEFQIHRQAEEREIDFQEKIISNYNHLSNLIELKNALSGMIDSAPGLDNISSELKIFSGIDTVGGSSGLVTEEDVYRNGILPRKSALYRTQPEAGDKGRGSKTMKTTTPERGNNPNMDEDSEEDILEDSDEEKEKDKYYDEIMEEIIKQIETINEAVAKGNGGKISVTRADQQAVRKATQSMTITLTRLIRLL